MAGKSSVISGYSDAAKSAEQTTNYSSLLDDSIEDQDSVSDSSDIDSGAQSNQDHEDLSDSRIDIDESDLPPFLRKKFYND